MPTIIHVTDRALVINHKIIVLLEVIRESRDRMYDPGEPGTASLRVGEAWFREREGRELGGYASLRFS